MEMAMRETEERERNGEPFSDDEYDDIFMGLSEPGNHAQSQAQSQDMDMS